MTLEGNVCELCYDVLIKELPCYDISKDKSMKMLIGLVVHYLEIETVGNFIICDNCSKSLRQLEQIWVACTETEKQIRLFKQVRSEIGMVKDAPLALKDLLAFHRDGEITTNIKNQLYCRLCMQWVPQRGFEFNNNSVHYVMLRNISRCWDFTSTIDPIICTLCQKTIEDVYNFREKCLNLRDPMRFQPEELSDEDDTEEDEDEDEELSKIEINEHDIKVQITSNSTSSLHQAYSCMYCGYVTPVQKYFKRHLKNKHRESDYDIIIGEREFSCNACTFKSKTSVELKIHIRDVHTQPAVLCESTTDRNLKERNDAPTITAEVSEESPEKTVSPVVEIVLRKSARIRIGKENQLALALAKENVSNENNNKEIQKINWPVNKGKNISKKNVNSPAVPSKNTRITRDKTPDKNINSKNISTPQRQSSTKRNTKQNKTIQENNMEKQQMNLSADIKSYNCIRCSFESCYKHSLKRHLMNVHKESKTSAENITNKKHQELGSPSQNAMNRSLKKSEGKSPINEKKTRDSAEKNPTEIVTKKSKILFNKNNQKTAKESPKNKSNTKNKSNQKKGAKELTKVSNNKNLKEQPKTRNKKAAKAKIDEDPLRLTRIEKQVASQLKVNGLTKTKQTLHQCADCIYATPLKKRLNYHRKILHNEDATVYDCGICNFKTKWKSCFTKHIKSNRHLKNVIQVIS